MHRNPTSPGENGFLMGSNLIPSYTWLYTKSNISMYNLIFYPGILIILKTPFCIDYIQLIKLAQTLSPFSALIMR